MVSLLQEYRTRHGLKCVMALDEGLCFFETRRQPAAVVLTSSHSRSLSACRKCILSTGGLVAESFVLTGKEKFPVFAMAKHEHVCADVDLTEWLARTAPSKEGNYEAFVARDSVDAELWLWRFFIRHNPLFARKWVNKEEPLRSTEQMTWCLGSHPHLFEEFYFNVYSPLFLGRKYLLFQS